MSSWFTDIAGKAEQMLEKLDKNAAAALNLDISQHVTSRAIPIEDDHKEIADVSDKSHVVNELKDKTPPPRKSTLAQLRGSRSNALKATRKKPPHDEEKNLLINYLNDSTSSLNDTEPLQRSCGSPSDNQDGTHFKTENTFLKSEIQSLNFEISRLLQKSKQAERDQQELISRQARVAELERNLQISRSEAQRLSKELQELQVLKSESHFELSTEIERLTKTLSEHEAQTSGMVDTNTQLESECSNLQNELVTIRENFEKYRTRAQSVLNEKDVLINNLRSGVQEDDTAEQIENEEIVLLRQDSQQLKAELEALRSELVRREEEKSQLSRALNEVQCALQGSRQSLASAEHELRFHKEEGQRLREEIVRAKRETESLRVADPTPTQPLASARSWNQQDAAADYVIDLDAKVRNLTATLVKKQQAVEILTAERNAMRLQLEKAELKLQDATRVYNRGILSSDLNTTDDAKAGLVPGFLRERLGESGVTRRVRRAYSALDSVTGSIMRRHPAARVCLFAYLLVLHIWVLGLLFSYTPDSK